MIYDADNQASYKLYRFESNACALPLVNSCLCIISFKLALTVQCP